MSEEHSPSALAIEDIVLPQGATESATWPTPWDYAEGSPLGVPAGWPGSWTARMQVRDYRGPGSTLLATFHSSDGTADGQLILTSATVDTTTYARVTPFVSASKSSAWTWADTVCEYDVEITNGSRVIRIVEGLLTLSSEVTTIA